MRRGVVFVGKLVAALAILMVGCAPQGQSQGGSPTSPTERAPKVLVVGAQRAAVGFGGAVGSAEDAGDLLSDGLVLKDYRGDWLPALAAQQISLQDGTWRINADGSMVTTWKLRPNVKWHDGTPFTSADLMFSWRVAKDPITPADAATASLRVMASAETPDPQTFIVNWNNIDVRANEAIGLTPRPRHLLESAYQTAPESLLTHAYFTSEFVGLGPYRLDSFDRGIEMQVVRFMDYYLGVPPIDRVIFKYMQDPTTMVANILAGAVDILIPPGLDVDAAIEMQRRWEGTGNRLLTAGLQDDFASAYTVQQRPDVAKPRNGATNRDVREALYRGIDRQTMSDAITLGLGPVADSWVAPGHTLRPDVEPIPQFPFDLTRAAQLLAGAGWVKGPDGVLVHNQTGERFEFELAGPTRPALQKQQAIIADGWKPLGVVGTIYVLSSAEDLVAENRSIRPGAYLGSIAGDQYYFASQLHSDQITSAANWSLRNRSGYTNPIVDGFYDRLRRTVDVRERATIHRDLVRFAMQDVALWPFYWDPYPVLALAKVQGGLYPAKGGMMNNIMEWDIVF